MNKLEEEIRILFGLFKKKNYNELVKENKEIHPNRIWYLLKKFENRRWIECGVSLKYPWLNFFDEDSWNKLIYEIKDFYNRNYKKDIEKEIEVLWNIHQFK